MLQPAAYSVTRPSICGLSLHRDMLSMPDGKTLPLGAGWDHVSVAGSSCPWHVWCAASIGFEMQCELENHRLFLPCSERGAMEPHADMTRKQCTVNDEFRISIEPTLVPALQRAWGDAAICRHDPKAGAAAGCAGQRARLRSLCLRLGRTEAHSGKIADGGMNGWLPGSAPQRRYSLCHSVMRHYLPRIAAVLCRAGGT